MTGGDYRLLIFFCIVILLIIYISVSNSNKRRQEIDKKLRSTFGKIPKLKLSLQDYENISHYFRNNRSDNAIDDITWNDLGMDDVFKRINNTNSSVGQEYLYRMLREPDKDSEYLNDIDRLSEAFSKNEEERISIQKIFVKLGHSKHISVTDYVNVLVDVKPGGNFIHYISGILILAALCVTLFIHAGIGVLLLVAAVAFSIITYYKYKSSVESYFICVNMIAKMLGSIDDIAALNIDFLKKYNDELSVLRTEFSTVAKNSWLIESGNVDGSLIEIAMDYLRMLTHLDLIKFNQMIRVIASKEKQIYKIIDTLGFIEATIAISSFRKSLSRWCVPVFVEGKMNFSVDNVYHPLIEEPVTNSITTKGNVLLTGSNASGKSTFLKTIAINALLSQTINTSVSTAYTAPRYRIYSSMALKDDLGNNESYYIVEIKSLKRILDAVETRGIPVLCFVDEVLRGTNTVERIAASSQILTSLEGKNCLCFAATHDIELTSILKKCFDNYHFQEEVTDDDVKFNYILHEGPATTRNAIKLLKVIGYDASIVEGAQKRASHFLEQGDWKC